MNNNDETGRLPVRWVDNRPIVIGAEPEHELVPAHEAGWLNIASQRHVRGLAIDPDTGELWLGTGGGVLRWRKGFNRFTRYTSEHGLRGNSVTAVAVDGTGRIWAAHAAGGLSYLDDDLWRPFSNPALDEAEVSCLSVDSLGRLWVGTTRWVYAIGDVHDGISATIRVPGDPPRAITVTPGGSVWLCNAFGLHEWLWDETQPHNAVGTHWRTYNTLQDILSLAWKEQSLWLGTMQGLERIDLRDHTHRPVNGSPNCPVTIVVPSDQGVWAAAGGRIGLWTDGTWTLINGQQRAMQVTGLVAASSAEVWIGTHDGLLRGGLTGRRWHLTDTPPDVMGVPSLGHSPERPPATLSNLIQTLTVQQSNEGSFLWIGTPHGLFRLDLLGGPRLPSGWHQYYTRDRHDVRAVVAAEHGGMWVASWNGGVQCLAAYVSPGPSSCLPGPALGLAVGPEAELWAVRLDGLYRANGAEWELALPTGALPFGTLVRATFQAKAGRVWLGTSAGLFNYTYGRQPDRLTRSSSPFDTADIHALLAVLHGQRERLWIGTSRGLYDWLDTHESAHYRIGIVDDRLITCLAWDSTTESVWVGTEDGLFRIAHEEVISTFTAKNSGLANDRVTALALAIGESGQRNLWVGTPCGLSRYAY